MYSELGELAWQMQLDAFGIPRFEQGSPEDCPFRFPGQYEDTDTSLYYNRHRYYSPQQGTYLSQDPIGLLGGLHPYAYVTNPTSWIDPLGLAGCKKAQRTGVMDDYQGVRDLSAFLKAHGVARDRRLEVVQSFASGSIRSGVATHDLYGFRFYGGRGEAMGQYLTDTFTPMTNRANLALPHQWNAMTGIKQWQIQPGTRYFVGKVGPQTEFGSQYVGGATQYYVFQPWKYGSLR